MDIYLPNKYTKWYYSIIEKASSQGRTKQDSYFEAHHIIPKSIIENDGTVLLTAREHFICHLLLTKMVIPEYKSKMSYALWMLCNAQTADQKRSIVSSHTYAYAKKEIAVATSIHHTGKIISPETRRRISKSQKGKILTETHKQNLRINHVGTKGCKYTEESKRKMSEAQRKRWAKI